MTYGSLFSGIGGMDLGLDRAGMECRWQVEIDPWCRRVLAKHWPDVPKYDDVRTVGRYNLEPVDLIAGGFPCQDVSNAGKRIGLEGERSGLWSEFWRLIGDLRPRFALVENVPGLFARGFGQVIGDLTEIGYDAEWSVLPTCALGAPHTRERVFILAYPHSGGADKRGQCRRIGKQEIGETERYAYQWKSEPRVERVVDGVPNRLDRLGGLGNAVVPQVAEWIGRKILEYKELEV